MGGPAASQQSIPDAAPRDTLMLWAGEDTVIYSPKCVGLTSLSVFAAGADVGAREGLHTPSPTSNRVSLMPGTGCSGGSGRP